MNLNNILFSETSSTTLILKLNGNECNLDCTYCFEKKKNIAQNKTISPQDLTVLLESIQSKVSVLLHGGEPLMLSISTMIPILEIIRKNYSTKIKSVKLQTNATLLSNKWIDLLFDQYADLNIEISISLDGIQNLNYLRVDNHKRSTYSKVRQAFSLLEEKNIKAGILSVVSKSTLLESHKYMDIFSEIPNVKFIKLIPLFNIDNNKLSNDSITPIEYSKFIIRIGKEYIKNQIYKTIPIEPLLSMFQKINGRNSKFCNFTNNKCFNFLSIYPETVVGPCDSLPISDFIIPLTEKNLFESINNYVVNTKKTDKLKYLLNQCENCDIYDFCTGGCLAQRFYFYNNLQLSKQYCESKKMLYKFSLDYVI